MLKSEHRPFDRKVLRDGGREIDGKLVIAHIEDLQQRRRWYAPAWLHSCTFFSFPFIYFEHVVSSSSRGCVGGREKHVDKVVYKKRRTSHFGLVFSSTWYTIRDRGESLFWSGKNVPTSIALHRSLGSQIMSSCCFVRWVKCGLKSLEFLSVVWYSCRSMERAAKGKRGSPLSDGLKHFWRVPFSLMKFSTIDG